MMLGRRPNIYWKICWLGVSPAVVGVSQKFPSLLFTALRELMYSYMYTYSYTYTYSAHVHALNKSRFLCSIPAMHLHTEHYSKLQVLFSSTIPCSCYPNYTTYLADSSIG